MPPPILRFLKPPSRSFFLFGPRGTGKSTWLNQAFPNALRLDLLDTALSLELVREPHRLEGLLAGNSVVRWVLLDEIQRIPALLSEVHRLMAHPRWNFALCGSSARKLKRGGADLLAGRALTVNMEGFSAGEIGSGFRLDRALEWGTLPLVHEDPDNAAEILQAYVHTYIKEEIREEGIIRQTPPFLRFLQVAGIMNGQMVNASGIAGQAEVPRSSVDNYFSILEDTLLGHFLPAYQPGVKVRERAHPKFYWFDPGVARAAAGLLFDPMDSLWKGWALETLVFHELRVRNQVSGLHRPISFYRTSAGVEIDFVLELQKRTPQSSPRLMALEVKSSRKWDTRWNKPLQDFAHQNGLRVDRLIGIYLGDRRYTFDRLEVLPAEDFFEQLHQGHFF